MNKGIAALKCFPKAFLLSSLFAGGYLHYYKQKNSHPLYALRKSDLEKQGKIPEYFDEINIDEFTKKYPNLSIIKSKAIDVLIGRLRDKDLNREQFRIISRRIIRFIIEEALANECDQQIVRQSPLGYYKTYENSRSLNDYIAVSVMRSGNAMLDEILTIIPDIQVGKILVQRNEATEDKKTIFFFDKLPKNVENKRIFLLDPMLGTGGSVCTCINVLMQKGVKEENIIFLNLVSCADGLENLVKKHPKVKIITAKVDKDLLPNKYIAPGIGDFGDRYYGTEH